MLFKIQLSNWRKFQVSFAFLIILQTFFLNKSQNYDSKLRKSRKMTKLAMSKKVVNWKCKRNNVFVKLVNDSLCTKE